MIIKNAEPFYFPGNSTGCLLIHGFSGAPTEMRPLGDFLAEKGYSFSVSAYQDMEQKWLI